ncbi:MAG: very short patch repair endonuclease [Verrucomicrobiota bacterium]|jgi:DNA mismatch endonuclease, patch repair protein
MSHWPGRSKYTKTTFGGLFRSELMARIRSRQNATTELKLLLLLRLNRLRGWRRGFPLLGNPDFVFPKSKLAIFVDGCFWHGHDCGRNLKPKRNAAKWREKIQGNRNRDFRVICKLHTAGWRVVRIWECALAKRPELCIKRIQRALI